MISLVGSVQKSAARPRLFTQDITFPVRPSCGGRFLLTEKCPRGLSHPAGTSRLFPIPRILCFVVSLSFSLYSCLCIFYSVFFCAIIMAVIRRFSCPSYRLISPGTSSPSTGSPDFSPAVSPQRKPSPSLPCAPQSQSRWHSALPALPLLWYL